MHLSGNTPIILTTVFFVLVTISASQVAAAQSFVEETPKDSPINKLQKPPLPAPVFIENIGQFDPKVKFQAKIGSQTAWLTKEGIVFDATRQAGAEKVVAAALRPSDSTNGQNAILPFALKRAKPESRTIDRLVFSEDFVGASCCSNVEGKDPRPGIYNYFQGNDSAKWRTNVQGYSEVVYRDLWPGVDLRIYGNGPDLEQEFIIQPGSDLSLVEIAYRGIENVDLAGDGSLEVHTAFGKLRETRPLIYQEIAGKREQVNGRFSSRTSTSYGFQVDSYKPEYALVVDPTLLYSTFLGGSDGDYAFFANNFGGYHLGEYAAGIAVDASGNTYVAGFTGSTDFPTTTGAFKVSGSGGFVSKLNATGSALIYSTYLGPSISAIAVDSAGRAYVTGGGDLRAFPTTSTAYYPHCNQDLYQDLFVTELNPTGSQLVYSTCFGAIGASPAALALDSSGRVFIAGSVSSSVGNSSGSVPTTSNAFQAAFPGGGSAPFVMVIDTTASGTPSLVYSTYLGITQDLNTFQGAYANSLTVDSFGKLYVVGATTDGFPVTAGAFQTAHKGSNQCYFSSDYQGPITCHDAFVAKLDPLASSGASSLMYSTYLGGIGEDSANGIAVDAAGNAYVTGTNSYADFPVTPGAFQTIGPHPNETCAFVAKLNAGGSALIYSTYIRNSTTSDSSTGSAIGLDPLGDAYITGSTSSAGFPVTPDAVQPAKGDPTHDFTDAFLTKLNATGSGLLYSSYLGGSGNDVAKALAIDATGDAYVTGYTESPNFPFTPFAFQPVLNPNPLASSCSYSGCHGGDAFVTKVSLGTSAALSITSIVPVSGGNAGTVSPQIFGTGLHDGATANLNCGGLAIPGTNLSVGPGGRFLNTTFDLTAALPGTCDVVVTNPDNTQVTLSHAFTIRQGGAPNIKMYLTGVEARKVPSEVSVGPADALLIATVSNTGSVDSTGGVVSLPLNLNSPFTLTSASPPGLSNVARGSSDDFEVWVSGPIAAGTSQTFMITATNAAAPVCSVLNTLVEIACIAVSPLVSIAACEYQELLHDGTACAEALDSCNTAFVDCTEQGEFSPVCLADVGVCLNDALECTKDSVPAVASCIQKYASVCISGLLPCVQPMDPNNLSGPPGIGGQRWIAGTQALSYAISFNNEPTATAPAQQVVVTQPLGANVNLSTLTLPAITVPNSGTDVTVPIPAGAFNPAANVNEFTTNVDLRPTQSLLVNVDAKLNPAAQTLTWTFTSIDPTTGLPPLNPLIGFLPPGAGANVSFSVTPTPGLATGTQVAEQATIVFQGSSPMSTATWTNTIDNTAPVSHVAALAATSTCPSFRVTWSGSDVGSGLQGFTIYVSDSGGAFTVWLSNTTSASATFAGAVGHTYSFYSVATDLTGNLEVAKTSAETSTTVAAAGPCSPPSLNGQVLSSSRSGTAVTVNLQLTNSGFTAAQSVNINQITFRTLSGSGTVTLASPALPAALGSLGVGASTTASLTLNVPSTVTRFSLTESGNLVDRLSNSYNYSIAQTIIP